MTKSTRLNCFQCNREFVPERQETYLECPHCHHCYTAVRGTPVLMPSCSSNAWQEEYEGLAASDIPDWKAANWKYEKHYEASKAVLRDLLADRKGGKILDVGCGRGDFSTFLTAKNALTGVDFSLNMLRHAERKGYETFVADATRLPFPDGQFDTLICTALLQIVDRDALLSECVRVVRPGGVVAFETVNDASLLRRVRRRLLNFKHVDKFYYNAVDDLIRTAARLGLEPERVGWTYAPTGLRRSNGTTGILDQWMGTNFLVRFRKIR
ncbi:MAG: class I SAM-dependent methyltransferase [Pseudodesulfovibrio sp.]